MCPKLTPYKAKVIYCTMHVTIQYNKYQLSQMDPRNGIVL